MLQHKSVSSDLTYSIPLEKTRAQQIPLVQVKPHQMAVAGADPVTRMYDRRMLTLGELLINCLAKVRVCLGRCQHGLCQHRQSCS